MKITIPKVSVQILNYNGKRFLKDCFNSLLKQEYKNYEIVLVDNDSSDGSIDFIKENYASELKNKKIRILALDKNYGFAEAYNLSYKQSDAEFVLLLNNDVIIPKKDFISELVKSSIKENAPLVNGWQYPLNISDLQKRSIYNLKYPTLSILGSCSTDVLVENNTLISGGGCLLINKSKIPSPLFPKEYFAYEEDVFLGWKSILQGNKIIFNKKAVFLHYGSGTSQKRSYFIRYNSEKNRLSNLLIFYKLKTLVKIFPLLLLEKAVKILYYLTKPQLFRAFAKAFIWDLENMKIILENRKEIQSNRKMTDKEIISKMSYKIFPETFYINISNKLNNLSKVYCKTFNIKTYDIN